MSRLITPITIITNNEYQTIFIPVTGRGTKVMVHLKENDGNNIKYKVLGSLDNIVYESIIPETTINALESDYNVLIDPWSILAIQVKSATVDLAGKVVINVVRG